jgi:hypothetical protein
VLNAFVWGVIAAFSLVIGGLIASWMTIRQRALGLIMAFGAGVPACLFPRFPMNSFSRQSAAPR